MLGVAGILTGQKNYIAPAVVFDGGDYLTRGADLTGATTSKLALFSCWVYPQAAATNGYIYHSSNANFRIQLTSGSKFLVSGKNSGGSVILSATSNASYSINTWYHLLFAVDMADTGKRWWYINGSLDSTTWTTYTNDSINFSDTNHAIGAAVAGTTIITATLSDTYIAGSQWLDLSTLANRSKFRTNAGRPVFLGSDGSAPTGVAPLIYMRGAASNYATNKGTGGGFTTTGTLTDAAITPST